MPSLDQILQGTLILLLGPTVLWCGLMHARLRRFRVEHDELGRFVEALGTASDRAEAVLDGLKRTSLEIEDELLRLEAGGRRRGEELQRQCEQAGRLLRRLESAGAAAGRQRGEEVEAAEAPSRAGAFVGRGTAAANGQRRDRDEVEVDRNAAKPDGNDFLQRLRRLR